MTIWNKYEDGDCKKYSLTLTSPSNIDKNIGRKSSGKAVAWYATVEAQKKHWLFTCNLSKNIHFWSWNINFSMAKWHRDEKGLKILHFHLYGHFKSTWQVAKCCCKEIGHQQMTNPYDVYEKSTYQKVSQMRGWDSGGDFAVSFGCESCFSSETQSLCVAQSKSVPNMVVIMRIFREKWLRSSIGRSQGVRIPASLSEWGGEPV